MALDFKTTTFINSDKDLGSDKALYSSISADDRHGAILKIKRDYTFEMPYIKKVYKRAASEDVFAELKISADKILSAIPSEAVYPLAGRILLYIEREGDEFSVFANDFYQKGTPFTLGFTVQSADTAASDLAEAIAYLATRYNVGFLGKQIFNVTASGSDVTVKCTDCHSRFKESDALVNMPLGVHEFPLAVLFGNNPDLTSQDVFTLVERGANGFGTFSQLTKDRRLPTLAHTTWDALYKTDNPIPGMLYNQYIINYVAPSGTAPSNVVVGDRSVSCTQHCFWVRQDLAEGFETVITEVVGSGPVKGDPTAIFEEN